MKSLKNPDLREYNLFTSDLDRIVAEIEITTTNFNWDKIFILSHLIRLSCSNIHRVFKQKTILFNKKYAERLLNCFYALSEATDSMASNHNLYRYLGTPVILVLEFIFDSILSIIIKYTNCVLYDSSGNELTEVRKNYGFYKVNSTRGEITIIQLPKFKK